MTSPSPSQAGPPVHVLVVDDESAHVQALADTLRAEGYATAGYTSARAALAALGEERFDLLLSDLIMTEMDGIALIEAAHRIDPDVSAVIMTGEGTITTAVEAMKRGACDYILKPISLGPLVATLARALDTRRLKLYNIELQRQLRQRALELEAANRELDAFSFSVAHDLRAPVRHITSLAELLVRAAPALDDRSRRYLAMVSEAAKQMGRLIDDLLAFSHTHRAVLNQGAVDLGQVVGEARELLRQEHEGRSVSWTVGPLPTVPGDAALLRPVFVNLIGNALKYSRPRAEARIEIGTTRDAARLEECVVFVRDNGVGFDMRYADRLFGVFQRLHTAEEFEGTGIGLAIVQRIVARHGGRVWAEAKVNEGATFYVALPAGH